MTLLTSMAVAVMVPVSQEFRSAESEGVHNVLTSLSPRSRDVTTALLTEL